MTKQQQWLAQVEEPVLDPDRPIVDPHHHLWDHPKNRYLLDELLLDTNSGHNIVATVFVECSSMYRAVGPEAIRSLGETEFVNGIAAMAASGQYGANAVAAGIVSFVDLTLGEAAGPVLDAHMQASERFRGIRHAAGWDASQDVRNSHTNPPEGLLGLPDFRRGFEELARRQLTFDAWLYHPQINQLTNLAKAFPDTTIVFDHFGGPLGIGPYTGKQDEIFVQWQKDIEQLALCHNVVAKLGGVVMPVNGFDFHKRATPATSNEVVEATGRYHRHAIECFGAHRCMFESNFPVDKASVSYSVLWNAFKKIAAEYTSAEQDALFFDTAVRAYQLQLG